MWSLVRQRLKDVTLRMPPRKSELPISAVSPPNLRAMPVEDVIDTLNDKHGLTLSLGQLIQLVGERPISRRCGTRPRSWK